MNKKIIKTIVLLIFITLISYLVIFFATMSNKEEQVNLSIENECKNKQGRWVDGHAECEYMSKEWCDQSGGEWSECESACRHNPGAEICTLQCVPVCKFEKEDIKKEIKTTKGENDIIKITYPQPNDYITSPLRITGEARGNWYFEGSFPVILTDWDGLIIAEGYASANGEWMTEDFVPFTATIEFSKPEYKNNGSLILKKDNPSGLPEYDDALEITIFFK